MARPRAAALHPVPTAGVEALIRAGVLERAREAGASAAFSTLLRLPPPLDAVFAERIAKTHPQRAQRIERSLIELRAANKHENRPGNRRLNVSAACPAGEVAGAVVPNGSDIQRQRIVFVLSTKPLGVFR